MSKRPGDPGYAAGWCIHYRSPMDSKTCEAGVAWDRWRAQPHLTRPCFLTDKGESKPDAQPCEHLRRPTPEEIALHKGWHDKRMKLLGTVMVGIHPWRKRHQGKSAAEVVECPACKGRLHLSIAAVNSHVHGKCETADCVSWME